MNRASGNISRRMGSRKVCGGDFSTSRPRRFQVSRFRNLRSACCQRRRWAGQPFQVEIVLRLRRLVGKGDAPIGTGHAQVAQGEFVFLGAVPAHLHVVRGPAVRQDEAAPGLQQRFADEKVVGREALEGGGTTMPAVQRQQLVQQRGAGPPVADDEDGVALQLDPFYPGSVRSVSSRRGRRVEDAEPEVEQAGGKPSAVDAEAVSRQQAEEAEKVGFPSRFRPDTTPLAGGGFRPAGSLPQCRRHFVMLFKWGVRDRKHACNDVTQP